MEWHWMDMDVDVDADGCGWGCARGCRDAGMNERGMPMSQRPRKRHNRVPTT